MGFGVRQRPRSSAGCNFVSYCGIASQFVSKNLFSQLLQPTEIVIFNVSPGLTQFRCNFAQCVAFDEEQLQGLALVLGQSLENLLEAFPSQQSVACSHQP